MSWSAPPVWKTGLIAFGSKSNGEDHGYTLKPPASLIEIVGIPGVAIPRTG